MVSGKIVAIFPCVRITPTCTPLYVPHIIRPSETWRLFDDVLHFVSLSFLPASNRIISPQSVSPHSHPPALQRRRTRPFYNSFAPGNPTTEVTYAILWYIVGLDDSVIRYTTSYAEDGIPQKDGEENWNRVTGTPYAVLEDGMVVVLIDNEWIEFKTK